MTPHLQAQVQVQVRSFDSNRGHGRNELRRLLFRMALILASLMGAVAAASACFHVELAAFGHFMVQRFGLLGIFAGTFSAEAFSVPIPPYFYLFTTVAAGGAQGPAVGMVLLASVTGGHTGYFLAQPLSGWSWFRKRLVPSQDRIDALFARYGYWALVLAAVLPLPYSVCCYVAGVCRIPYRALLFYSLLQVPRNLVLYLLIRAGWR